MNIRRFRQDDGQEVISLWETCGLIRPWNDPQKDIARKVSAQPELFLVGELDGRIIASAMAGYDGHRGSLYYLAVHPDYQKRGYGRRMMARVEALLIEMGCPKLNIQVRSDNDRVQAFYERLDYPVDKIVNVGKRLIPDD